MEADRRGWARKAGGWTLLVVGVAGCVLPVAPGIPLVLAGLVILARDYKWARQVLRRGKRWLVRARARRRAAALARMEDVQVPEEAAKR
jgi:uncharacterized membrane protein YbaN (DUF454 family)